MPRVRYPSGDVSLFLSGKRHELVIRGNKLLLGISSRTYEVNDKMQKWKSEAGGGRFIKNGGFQKFGENGALGAK